MQGVGVFKWSSALKSKGRTPPYIYVWFKGGGSDSSRINLLPGQYTVVVSDAIGVADSVSFEIGILNAGATIEWEQILLALSAWAVPTMKLKEMAMKAPNMTFP